MSEKGENKMKGTSISDHDTAGPEETMKHDKAASCTFPSVLFATVHHSTNLGY
jgi:hypothetical protein